MTFPSLPPVRGREFEPGWGDEVEELLFEVKMSTLGKLATDPEADMGTIVKNDLQAMLEKAKENRDDKSAEMFQSALNRTSRVD